MENTKKQEMCRLTKAELTAKQDELEQEMREELAPIEAKYWEAVQETNLLHEEMKPLYEAYRARWEEKVVPHRRVINNIYSKYRRRLKKLTELLNEEELMRY
ncbi:MAG: hypothetical protein ACK5MU_04285 [Candidatus Saccharimonadales bacterium]